MRYADRCHPATSVVASANEAKLPVTRPASFPEKFAGGVVVIGNFDGVHLGHRYLIEHAASVAAGIGAPLGALTFEPHPHTLFSLSARRFRIAHADRKCDLLAASGIDFGVVEPFTLDLAHCPPEAFVQEYLVRRLQVRHVVVGEDYRFGYRRSGDIALLQVLGARLGFGVTALGKAGAEGAFVSSSRIRDLLQGGDVAGARRLLGRSWDVRGRLLRHHRGRVLVHVDAEYVRVPPGSYGVSVRNAEQTFARRIAEVPSTTDDDDFTIALRGGPVHALPGTDAQVEIAFTGPATRLAN